MPTAAEQNTRSTRYGLKVLAVGLMIALPALYFASIGPAARQVNAGRLRFDTYQRVYAPILRPLRLSPRWVDGYNWYMRLWNAAPIVEGRDTDIVI